MVESPEKTASALLSKENRQRTTKHDKMINAADPPQQVIPLANAPLILSFPGVSPAEANQYAADLAGALRDTHPDVQAEQRRDRDDTLDFGATLVLILGSASATMVARGVAAWLARNSGVKLQISADGSVVASNLDSRDASRIVEALSHRK
jgi:hypothetical protein